MFPGVVALASVSLRVADVISHRERETSLPWLNRLARTVGLQGASDPYGLDRLTERKM